MRDLDWVGYIDRWMECEGESCGIYVMCRMKEQRDEENVESAVRERLMISKKGIKVYERE